ncbi:MAG: phosphoenolpyruvate carboxykinase (ATP) [Gammaproteobacteria bacterium]|nr:phosphoenolpyruvate carboxykinase (ATP) [Gammaproteobacteria bacterium]
MDLSGALQRKLGLSGIQFKHNLPKERLFYEALAHDRGRTRRGGPEDERKAFATKLGVNGPLVFYTDPTCTGRPVNDTFMVAWPDLEAQVWWKDNLQKYDPEQFEALLERVVAHCNQRGGHLYVQDVFAGADPVYSVPYRFVGEFATHAMFAYNMFPKEVPGVDDVEGKRWTMLNVPSFRCQPERDGCHSERAVIVDMRNKVVLVAGRADYCGVVKKTIFTVMNFLLPNMGYLSMHCSANIGSSADAAILFGLSGTGKTTLSADSARQLIGDDETGWTGDGISNLEDGCYAKLIDLDKQAEPVIAAAMSMPGTIIENVPPLPGKPMEETDPQELDLRDGSITENIRFSYPLACNPNVATGARGGHPQTIVLLTADAFGVLPPVSVLNGNGVMYHFIQGFTAKLAGTEVGLRQAQATFSACFGAPFMPHYPSVYAKLLKEKMEANEARCILLNTGWRGGPAGAAPRMPIKDTRALLNAALSGKLHNGGGLDMHPVFNLQVPRQCPGVDLEVLDPRASWDDKAAYDAAAIKLRDAFRDNFEKQGFGKLGIEAVM